MPAKMADRDLKEIDLVEKKIGSIYSMLRRDIRRLDRDGDGHGTNLHMRAKEVIGLDEYRPVFMDIFIRTVNRDKDDIRMIGRMACAELFVRALRCKKAHIGQPSCGSDLPGYFYGKAVAVAHVCGLPKKKAEALREAIDAYERVGDSRERMYETFLEMKEWTAKFDLIDASVINDMQSYRAGYDYAYQMAAKLAKMYGSEDDYLSIAMSHMFHMHKESIASLGIR